MKRFLPISLLVIPMVLPGCAWMGRHATQPRETTTAGSAKAQAQGSTPTQSATIVTPDESLSAKVLVVNTVGRFVILNFPAGRMPRLGQHLFLYRTGLKTAEVKIVGPQQDNSIVADITSGDAQPGDTVRDQ